MSFNFNFLKISDQAEKLIKLNFRIVNLNANVINVNKKSYIYKTCVIETRRCTTVSYTRKNDHILIA